MISIQVLHCKPHCMQSNDCETTWPIGKKWHKHDCAVSIIECPHLHPSPLITSSFYLNTILLMVQCQLGDCNLGVGGTLASCRIFCYITTYNNKRYDHYYNETLSISVKLSELNADVIRSSEFGLGACHDWSCWFVCVCQSSFLCFVLIAAT